MTEKLLSEKELATRWGITQRTLQNWRAKGYGPKSITLSSNTVRYRLADVLAYEEERVGQTNQPQANQTKPEETTND